MCLSCHRTQNGRWDTLNNAGNVTREATCRRRRRVELPYRIEFDAATDDVVDRLIDLGALDVDGGDTRRVIALMPDHIGLAQIASNVGLQPTYVAPAQGRDSDSVWILRPRSTQVGRIRIIPADAAGEVAALRLLDTQAFGTGLHPTTALCLEALDDIAQLAPPKSVLDVGTGSGILALAALSLGVPDALGLDLDGEALRVAAENARINGMSERLQLALGGPESATGTWPLVLANVLAAPLIEMAPILVQRVGHHCELVLSGVPSSLAEDVTRPYRRLGMHRTEMKSRDGWVALLFRASW